MAETAFQVPSWAIVLYGISLSVYYKAVTTLFMAPLEINGQRGTHLQFLTIISLFTSIATQWLGMLETLASITGLKRHSQSLNRAKTISSYFSAPAEFVVAILFWAIYFKDPSLLISPERIGLIPKWLNYSVHVWPAVFESVNLLFCSSPWKIGFVAHSLLFVVFALGYLAWVHYAKNLYGFYPYPLMAILTPGQWAILFGGGVLIAVTSAGFLKLAQSILSVR